MEMLTAITGVLRFEVREMDRSEYVVWDCGEDAPVFYGNAAVALERLKAIAEMLKVRVFATTDPARPWIIRGAAK